MQPMKENFDIVFSIDQTASLFEKTCEISYRFQTAVMTVK